MSLVTGKAWRRTSTLRALGAFDELGLIVLPVLLGGGMQLTQSFSPDTGLTVDSVHALPEGSVEIANACTT